MRFGLIGAGNMGAALIKGALAAGYDAAQFHVFDVDTDRAKALGVPVCGSEEETVREADVTLLAVKPGIAPVVFAHIKDASAGKAIVSIMAGVRTSTLSEGLHKSARVMRTMPNAPFLAGEGASVFSRETTLTKEESAAAESLFATMGKVFWVQESQMDAVTGVSGSGPAYLFVFLEAMADAAVREGLPRDLAYALCAQTMKGAAEMALTLGCVPAALKDMVASPAGTTIEGLAALERGGFRASVMDAVHEATRRSRELGL